MSANSSSTNAAPAAEDRGEYQFGRQIARQQGEFESRGEKRQHHAEHQMMGMDTRYAGAFPMSDTCHPGIAARENERKHESR